MSSDNIDQDRIQELRDITCVMKVDVVHTVSDFVFGAQVSSTNGLPVALALGRDDCEETAASDLGVGLGCKYFTVGSLTRSENAAKVNSFLRIEEAYADAMRNRSV